MSRVSDLVTEFCPAGVEFKSLEELGSFFGGLNGKTKADFAGGNARFISYVNIFNNISVNTIADDFVRVGPHERQRTLQRGDVLFTGSSETPDAVGISSVVTTEVREPLYLNSFSIGYRLNDPKMFEPTFMMHLFRSRSMRKQIIGTASGVTRFNVSKARLAKVSIPIPPLEVQQEIVNVLDTFREAEAELETKLEAELEARQRQYIHYRGKLLSFGGDTRHASLRELVSFMNGKPHERLVDPSGDVALMTSKFISTQGRMARYVNAADVLSPARCGDVAVVMSDLPNGRALARAFYVNEDDRYAANQRVCLLRSTNPEVMTPRFLYYVVDRNPQLLSYDSGVDQTHLKKDYILDVSVAAPPLEEQEQIVSILDKFDALVNDLIISLPAELAARRKQYEYCRDQLLTFEEKVT